MGPYRKETRRILSFSSINKLGRGSFFLLRLKRPQFLINEGKIQASSPESMGAAPQPSMNGPLLSRATPVNNQPARRSRPTKFGIAGGGNRPWALLKELGTTATSLQYRCTSAGAELPAPKWAVSFFFIFAPLRVSDSYLCNI